MAEILNLDFNQLPRPTRERFIAITQGKAGPAPILQQRASGAGGCGWILLMGFFGLSSIAMVAAEFGEPYHATQPLGVAIVYVVLFFLSLLGLLGLVRSRVTKKALPFTPGVYVFAADTIIARSEKLKILSAREITNME